MVLYYYPVGNKLCYSPDYILARRAMNKALGRSYPVIAKLSAKAVSKFKPKFKRA